MVATRLEILRIATVRRQHVSVGMGGGREGRLRQERDEMPTSFFVKLREDKDAVHNSTNNYCRS